MMKTAVYNQKGEKAGTIELPENVFGVPWNADLVHQVIVSQQANARVGRASAHAKDRSEVRGGGKKPWRQKGTGRARHGSRRSPIWIGGGVTHGPRKEKNYVKKINKKMRRKALYTTLSQKHRDGELLFVDKLSFAEPKTKNAKTLIGTLASIKGFKTLTTKKNNTALIALLENNMDMKKSFSNFGNIHINEVRNLNPVDLLQYKYVIITNPKESIALLASQGAVKRLREQTSTTK